MFLSTRFTFSCSIASLLLLLFLVSCGSTPTPEELPVDTSAATPLFVPEIQDQGFFAFSDKSIMQDMEIGLLLPFNVQRQKSEIPPVKVRK